MMITSIQKYHASKKSAIPPPRVENLHLSRPRYNRLEKAELVLRIVFRLELAQFVQAPRFIPVDGLQRLVAFALGVIDIRLWLTLGLAGVPELAVLLGPRLGRVPEARPFRNFAEEDPIERAN